MEDFKHFSKEDSEIIQKELAVLQGMVKREDRLITGYNYYFEYIDPEKLVISISFLHRSDALRKEFESDLKSGRYTLPLFSKERREEIPFTRKKRAVYRAFPNFNIQRDEKSGNLDSGISYIDLETLKEIPNSIIEKCKFVKDIAETSHEYRNRAIGIKESNGYEINLNVKSKEEAFEVLDLLRKKAYSIQINENGLPIYDEYGDEMERDKDKVWTSADAAPCIILGKDIEGFLGERLPDFNRCEKTYMARRVDENTGEEVSFITHDMSVALKQHEAYQRLKRHFGDALKQIPVLANNALIVAYIDRIRQI